VINADVEDVEMAVETDEDEEEAVLDELGGECWCDVFTIIPTNYYYAKMRMRMKKRKAWAAVYLPAPKEREIRNSLLGTRVTGHTSSGEIRLVSSGINRTRLNTSPQLPISRI
jgi:hypothetical protein